METESDIALADLSEAAIGLEESDGEIIGPAETEPDPTSGASTFRLVDGRWITDTIVSREGLVLENQEFMQGSQDQSMAHDEATRLEVIGLAAGSNLIRERVGVSQEGRNVNFQTIYTMGDGRLDVSFAEIDLTAEQEFNLFDDATEDVAGDLATAVSKSVIASDTPVSLLSFMEQDESAAAAHAAPEALTQTPPDKPKSSYWLRQESPAPKDVPKNTAQLPYEPLISSSPSLAHDKPKTLVEMLAPDTQASPQLEFESEKKPQSSRAKSLEPLPTQVEIAAVEAAAPTPDAADIPAAEQTDARISDDPEPTGSETLVIDATANEGHTSISITTESHEGSYDAQATPTEAEYVTESLVKEINRETGVAMAAQAEVTTATASEQLQVGEAETVIQSSSVAQAESHPQITTEPASEGADEMSPVLTQELSEVIEAASQDSLSELDTITLEEAPIVAAVISSAPEVSRHDIVPELAIDSAKAEPYLANSVVNREPTAGEHIERATVMPESDSATESLETAAPVSSKLSSPPEAAPVASVIRQETAAANGLRALEVISSVTTEQAMAPLATNSPAIKSVDPQPTASVLQSEDGLEITAFIDDQLPKRTVKASKPAHMAVGAGSASAVAPTVSPASFNPADRVETQFPREATAAAKTEKPTVILSAEHIVPEPVALDDFDLIQAPAAAIDTNDRMHPQLESGQLHEDREAASDIVSPSPAVIAPTEFLISKSIHLSKPTRPEPLPTRSQMPAEVVEPQLLTTAKTSLTPKAPKPVMSADPLISSWMEDFGAQVQAPVPSLKEPTLSPVRADLPSWPQARAPLASPISSQDTTTDIVIEIQSDSAPKRRPASHRTRTAAV